MPPSPITVLIPVYNAERNLPSCVDALLQQTQPFFELIIVDNNSTDSSKEIILKLATQDSRIRYVFEGQRSRGAARNTGVSAAQ